MTQQCYVGIDRIKTNEWIVVLWMNGKYVFSRPFKNISDELDALVCFINERCERPKICLNPVNPNALKLIKSIGNIPGVEVVLMSNAGLKLHLDWLPDDKTAKMFEHNVSRAYLLACCAERMI